MKKIINQSIKIYKKTFSTAVSPLLKLIFPVECRFYPTCSVYAQEAINEYGALQGVWMTIKRIGRCHPFHAGGVDLVPVRK